MYILIVLYISFDILNDQPIRWSNIKNKAKNPKDLGKNRFYMEKMSVPNIDFHEGKRWFSHLKKLMSIFWGEAMDFAPLMDI